MGRTLPITERLPWDESAIESSIRSRNPDELVAYLKKLIRTLTLQYGNISNVVNIISADITWGAAADRPTASATQRGKIYVTESGTGVADVVEVCLKSTGDTYSWKNMATG